MYLIRVYLDHIGEWVNIKCADLDRACEIARAVKETTAVKNVTVREKPEKK